VALELGTDALEDEAVRRAYHGNDRPVTFQGKVTDTFKEYSDNLLMFMLKARRPDKFKERFENKSSIEHSASPALRDLLQRIVASKPALPIGGARLAQRTSVGRDPARRSDEFRQGNHPLAERKDD
jgi:hypothetical protein